VIYAITDRPDAKRVKFGYAADAAARLADLNRVRAQCCSDEGGLVMLASCEGSLQDEKRLHAALVWCRLAGHPGTEWYRSTPTVRRVVEAIAGGQSIDEMVFRIRRSAYETQKKRAQRSRAYSKRVLPCVMAVNAAIAAARDAIAESDALMGGHA
jgi:hypothetical protein